MSAIPSQLQVRLAQWQSAGFYRQRIARAGTPLAARHGDQPIVNFASNDYLGLAGDARVVEAFCRGAQEYGVGAGASDLISGYTDAHAMLEDDFARFTRRPRALVFSTGYMANLSVVTVLVRRGGCVLEDRLNHASLIDAAILSRAKLLRYAHTDGASLAERLRAVDGKDVLVVTDGVFSMDGDIAALPELAGHCRQNGATLALDDAHGIGVLGASGAGTTEHFGLDSDSVPVLVGTCGKALGVFGAFVAGGETIIESLAQFARPYVYTTALPPAVAVAVAESLRIVQSEPQRRERLHCRIRYFKERATARGLPLTTSVTPIQPVIIGDSRRTVQIADALRAGGFLVGAIRPPTVPNGTARLRITLSAAHTEADIEALVDRLARLL